MMPCGARVYFGRFDKRPPDALSAPVKLDVPPFNEWDRGRATPRSVRPVLQFQESDEPPVAFCHKDGAGVWLSEIFFRLGIVIGERAWPQRLAQTNPVVT